MDFRYFSVFIFIASFSAGCALTEDVAQIDYVVDQTIDARPGAEHVNVSVAAQDARTANRTRVSAKVNGYGMDMAAIRLAGQLEDAVRRAIEDELSVRGFNIAEGGARIEAAVHTFYNDFHVGAWSGEATAETDLTIRVVIGNATAFEERFVGVEKLNGLVLSSGDNAGKALTASLQNALSQAFSRPRLVTALLQADIGGGDAADVSD